MAEGKVRYGTKSTVGEAGNRLSSIITKCDPEKAKKFIYHIIDDVCGQKGPVYDDYSDVWTLMEWWDAIDSSKHFIKHVVGSQKDFSDTLTSLPTEYKEIVTECLNIRSDDLRDAHVEETHRISSAFLKDFDWKLKLILSSDKMATIREPMLALNFDIEEDKGRKLLSLDMSKEELKNMIDCLEEANKVVSDLKT